MKTWKLVSGILSIVLFVLVAFQSCAAGLSNALQENGEKSSKKGGNIALIILFGLAALIGFASHGSYGDLVIWSGWCLLNAILAVVAIVTGKKKDIEADVTPIK